MARPSDDVESKWLWWSVTHHRSSVINLDSWHSALQQVRAFTQLSPCLLICLFVSQEKTQNKIRHRMRLESLPRQKCSFSQMLYNFFVKVSVIKNLSSLPHILKMILAHRHIKTANIAKMLIPFQHIATKFDRKFAVTNSDTHYIADWRVFKILDKLRPTATGLDGLPAWFLRLGAPIFCDLFHICLTFYSLHLQYHTRGNRPGFVQSQESLILRNLPIFARFPLLQSWLASWREPSSRNSFIQTSKNLRHLSPLMTNSPSGPQAPPLQPL